MGLGVFFFLFLPSLFSRHSSINPSIRQASRRASLFVLAFCFSRCSRFSRIKFVHIIIYPYPTYIHRIMIALDWTRFFCLFHFVHIQQKSTMYKCISSSLYRIFAFWSFCTLRSIYSALLCYFRVHPNTSIHTFTCHHRDQIRTCCLHAGAGHIPFAGTVQSDLVESLMMTISWRLLIQRQAGDM